MQKCYGLIIIFLPLFLFSQSPTLQSIRKKIDEYSSRFPKERIYIQFDKPAYSPGETIWYKAYLMSAIDISTISANLYVDLTDAEGNVTTHTALPIEQASAQGSLVIPITYAQETVHIRAYTKWMLNFDSSFLYDKDIHIIQSKASTSKVTVNKPTVQFFPEGGACIAGINTKVAFKATFSSGKPCAVSGVVMNGKGQNVAEIKSIHDGMGFFYIESGAGEKFIAKWKDEQGRTYQTSLPDIKEAGATLELKIENQKRGYLIKRSPNALPTLSQLYIVATFHQQLVYMASVKLQTDIVGGSIPVEDLPSGILQVSLFDSNWVAIAERITFINNDNYYFTPEVGFSALGTGKHGKNTLVINVPDSIESNLSVAVTDVGIGIDSSDNMITHLLVTGELKGRVYHPAYYLTNGSDTLQQQLDLIMLTNGWRRIKWEDIIHDKIPVIKYPADTAYFSLAGKVFGASTEDLRESALLLLILEQTKDTSRETIQSFLEKDGSFAQPDIILFDTTKVYYSLAKKKNVGETTEINFSSLLPSSKKIFFDREASLDFSDSATKNRYLYFAEEQARLSKLLQGSTLADVTVKAKTKSVQQVLDEKYTSGLFSGGDAKQFDVTNDPFAHASLNVLSYLQGKVAGLTISAGGAQSSVSWRGGTPAFF